MKIQTYVLYHLLFLFWMAIIVLRNRCVKSYLYQTVNMAYILETPNLLPKSTWKKITNILMFLKNTREINWNFAYKKYFNGDCSPNKYLGFLPIANYNVCLLCWLLTTNPVFPFGHLTFPSFLLPPIVCHFGVPKIKETSLNLPRVKAKLHTFFSFRSVNLEP